MSRIAEGLGLRLILTLVPKPVAGSVPRTATPLVRHSKDNSTFVYQQSSFLRIVTTTWNIATPTTAASSPAIW